MTRPWTCLDLFAGCGGLSLGAIQAGATVTAAVEVDKWAADTYEANHPNVKLYRKPVQELSSSYLSRAYGGRVDLLVGGPPCQGFSVSGKRQYGIHLPGNKLVQEYIRVVEAVRPKAFILENVRGLKSATIDGKKPALQTILSGLLQLGYDVSYDILQAADYGLPQYRSRLFVIGTSWAQERSPFPRGTKRADATSSRWRYRGCLEAISDLPVIEARGGSDGPVAYESPAANRFQSRLRGGSQWVHNHRAMNHTPRLIERFKTIPPGGAAYKIGRSEATAAANTVTVYKSNNQRLVADLPSLCITANFQSTYIHPTLNRNLTAREAARLQTFPDTFVFKGRRTLMSAKLLKEEGRDAENHLSQYNQIGNAVPPLLAAKIVQSVMQSEGDLRPRCTLSQASISHASQ